VFEMKAFFSRLELAADNTAMVLLLAAMPAALGSFIAASF
jgi:hypothetical protein